MATRIRTERKTASARPAVTADHHDASSPDQPPLKSALPFVLGWFVLPAIALIVLASMGPGI